MLHGSSIDIDAVPTEADLKEADAKAGPNTLMQMTYANFHGPKPAEGIVFFDSG